MSNFQFSDRLMTEYLCPTVPLTGECHTNIHIYVYYIIYYQYGNICERKI